MAPEEHHTLAPVPSDSVDVGAPGSSLAESSLFGLAGQLDAELCSLALIFMITLTLMLELFTHTLEHRLEGTPFIGMLNKVYKELMIMGLIGFGVKMLSTAGLLQQTTTYFAFEVSDLTIFFTAIFFVTQATLLILLSAKLKKQCDLATKVSVDTVQAQLSLQRKSAVYKAVWLPWSPLREGMEFLIMSRFFLRAFEMPINFDFGLYMRYSIDEHILSLLDIKAATWLIVIGLLLLNWARIVITEAAHGTGQPFMPDLEEHKLNEHNIVDGMEAFIIAGWVLVVMAVLYYFVARSAEIKLLYQAGVRHLGDYEKVLDALELERLEAVHAHEASGGSNARDLARLRAQIASAEAKQHGRGKGRENKQDDSSSSRRSRHGAARAVAVTIKGTLARAARVRKQRPGVKHAHALRSSGCSSGSFATEGSAYASEAGSEANSRSSFASDVDDDVSVHRESPLQELSLLSSPALASAGPGSAAGASSPVRRTSRNKPGKGGALLHRGAAKVAPLSSSASPNESGTNSSAGSDYAVTDALPTQQQLQLQRSQSRAKPLPLQQQFSSADSVGAASCRVVDFEAASSSKSEARQGQQRSRSRSGSTGSSSSTDDSDSDIVSPTGQGLVYAAAGGQPALSSSGTIGTAGALSSSSAASSGIKRRMSAVDRLVQARKSIAQLPAMITVVRRRISSKPGDLPPVEPEPPKELALGIDVSHIYPFSSPQLFHQVLDLLLLLNCFYSALWATQFVVVARGVRHEALYQALMVMPMLLNMPLLAQLIKTSSLLLAVSAIKPDLMGRVVDEQMDTDRLVDDLRRRLIGRFESLGLGKNGLTHLYEELTQSGREGGLSLPLLKDLATRVGFHVSAERMKHIFKVMDKDQNNTIMYQEMYQVLYPEDFRQEQNRALKMKAKMGGGSKGS